MNKSIILIALLATLTAITTNRAIAQTDQAQPALSMEELVTLRQVNDAVMSPNGDAIAYLLAVPRQLYVEVAGASWQELHVVNLEGESRPYMTGEVNVTDLAWSADGRALYFVAKTDPEAEFADIYRMPIDGGAASVIFTAKSAIKSIHPGPAGERLAFLASEPEPETKKTLDEQGFNALVYEESVKPAKVWLLDEKTGEASAQDIRGSASALRWSPDGKRYAVALAPTPLIDDEYMARDIFIVSADTARVQGQMNAVGKLDFFDWSPDGKKMGWIGAEDIHDPSAGRLYVASIGGGEKRDLVPGYEGQIEDFNWHDGDSIGWVGSRRTETELGRVTLAQMGQISTVKTGPVIRQLHVSPGQLVAAAVADAPSHPQEVYLVKDGATMVRLTHSNPLLEQRRLARQEVIRYQARDGLELDAILIHPFTEPPAGGSPLVMMIHGGPESHYSNGWMSSYGRPAQVLASQGYLIVYPNYRGSTGRGVEFSKMGQHDYAAGEFNDIVDAKQHLVKQGLADSDRTGITGGSYGGYASMWAASALSEHFAAAVAFVGISNQISKFGTTDIPQEMYNVHARAWPWEDWMWMLERSPVFHADKVKTPLLIMHGDKDPRVHPAQSMEMYRNVKVRTDTPVRLVYYPGEGHGNKNTSAQYDYALRLERWMNHFLKDEGDSLPPFEIDHAARLAEVEAEASQQD